MLTAYYITDFGLSTYGNREIARSKERLEELVINIQTIRVGFAAIVFSIAVVFALFYFDDPQMKLLFVFSFLYLFPYALGLDWAYKGLQKMAYASLWTTSLQLIFLILIILFIKNYADLIYVPIYRMLGVCFASCVLLWTFYKAALLPLR